MTTDLQSATVSETEFNTVAQWGHFAAGIAWMTGWRTMLGYSLKEVLITLAIGVGIAAWKEFYYDPRHETIVEQGSGLEDFSRYVFGFMAGVFLIWIGTLLGH
jgi:hypothetical protein